MDYCTPLHLACHNGRTEMIKTLVEEFHAKVNLKDKVCVHLLYKPCSTVYIVNVILVVTVLMMSTAKFEQGIVNEFIQKAFIIL